MWDHKTNDIYEYRDVILLQRNYFPKKSVTPEQATVPLLSLHIDREPNTDIIEVREVNDDGSSVYIS